MGTRNAAVAGPASATPEGPPPFGYLDLPSFTDGRGQLVVGEGGTSLPFAPARFFTISAVPPTATRADHANRACAEVLVCLTGSCVAELDDGNQIRSYRLDRPDLGLSCPPGVWLVCRHFSADAVLLVLASHPYDPADRIDDYAEYLEVARGRAAP